MAKRFKLNVGDVFTIPLENDEFGIGQIVYMPNHKHNFIMIVFDKKYNLKEEVDLNGLQDLKVLFLGYTVDAKLYHKHWEIIGNTLSNLSSVKFPCYKLGLPNDDYPDGARLVDHKGNVLANIDKDTFDSLSYQNEVGPIRFQNALKAHFGLQEWIPEDYDKILYVKTLESVKIAEEILNNE
ncbi:Imm26 family immunity protein [Chryseobacterium sp. KCF3-3]|uniref:Imm26 family immunity protein n=1 Tax=Chryseobacterium sp. KCF3-3 TaxID=3231511 RepID=UPI0038B4159E